MLVLVKSLELVKSQSEAEIPLDDLFATLMEHAGMSITITSFTNMLAFGSGTLTVIPAIGSFAVYAAVTVFMDYLMQISFFLAFMVRARR